MSACLHECVCGEPATTTVAVQWAASPGERRPSRRRRYRYCEECAAGVVFAIEGAQVVLR